MLKSHESKYWEWVEVCFYDVNDDTSIAVDRFLKYGKISKALDCLYFMLSSNFKVDTNQCLRVLFSINSSKLIKEYEPSINKIVELIRYLQEHSFVEDEILYNKIERRYLILFYKKNITNLKPKYIELKLANDAQFFCRIIRVINYYYYRNGDPSRSKSKETMSFIASILPNILLEWSIPPGTLKDGTFQPERFKEWIKTVKDLCKKPRYYEEAMFYLAHVLVYAPSDPDGLWIHRDIASFLNQKEEETLREYYNIAISNSRNIIIVYLTGKQERLPIEELQNKAEEAEKAGFFRLAQTIRNVASKYK